MKATLISLSVLLCVSTWGQDSKILETCSPKLRQFVISHAVASATLSKTIAEAFTNRSVQLYYFYSDNESVPRATHSYPDESSVTIVIRENQQPCDEYICLIFEMVNSEGEQRFRELIREATSLTISKGDFVKEIMRQEFTAVRKIQALLGSFKLNQKEVGESYFYNRFMQCPSDFNEFLSYKKKVSPNRDQVKEYEQLYDSLQKNP